MSDHSYIVNLIWQITGLLKKSYLSSQYERVVLPMTILRRFDCVLSETKADVLAQYEQMMGDGVVSGTLDAKLNSVAGQCFHNHSPLDFNRILADPNHVASHLVIYIEGFSFNVREIFENFAFVGEIKKMDDEGILYPVVKEFSNVNLYPEEVSNDEMSFIFEKLIERSSDHKGSYRTPSDVVELMVRVLFNNDDEILSKPSVEHTLLDPACGTGGMLVGAQRYIQNRHKKTKLCVYGQDYNNHACAVAASNMLIRQADCSDHGDNIKVGDIITNDQFKGETFDYILNNPPFSMVWKEQRQEVKREHHEMGREGRFDAGMPQRSELLFLQHAWAKRKPASSKKKHEHGSRLAIVSSESPLSSGGAGSGESNIRKWIIENDWLEAIIALPDHIFYYTGIGVYIWIITNHKEARRKNKVQLIDVRNMPTSGGSPEGTRSIGMKHHYISEKQIDYIVRYYDLFQENDCSRIFDNDYFGYARIVVEQPLRLRFQITPEDKLHFLNICPELTDDIQEIDKTFGRKSLYNWNAVWEQVIQILEQRGSCWTKRQKEAFRYTFTERDAKGDRVLSGNEVTEYEPDKKLRDFIKVPIGEDVETHFSLEVLPHAPHAWMNRDVDKIGYEIKYFNEYEPPEYLKEAESISHDARRKFASLKKVRS